MTPVNNSHSIHANPPGLLRRLGAFRGRAVQWWTARHATAASPPPAPQQPRELREWHANLSVILPIYERTQDEHLKEQMRFLVLNYLFKAAPIALQDVAISPEVADYLRSRMQLGVWNPGLTYNRESSVFDAAVTAEQPGAFAPASGKRFIVVDAHEIDHLLRLHFTLFTPEATHALVRHLGTLGSTPTDLSTPLARPIMIDCTALMGAHIHDPEACGRRIGDLACTMTEAIDAACVGHDDRFGLWVRLNMIFVCKCEVAGVPLLKLLPVWNSASIPEELHGLMDGRPAAQLNHFLSCTGVRLGSVRGRAWIASRCSLTDLINPYVGDTYPSLQSAEKGTSLTSRAVFQRLQRLCDADHGYLASLGRPTLQLVDRCLAAISERVIYCDRDRRELVQCMLYRIHDHVANAEVHARDFTRFAQEMELVHYELMALLTLVEPFKDADFSAAYVGSLGDTIPEALRSCVCAGMTKSASNTFAGLMSQVRDGARAIYTDGSHFEFVDQLGEESAFSAVSRASELASADLYLGEYNHNIDLKADRTLYRCGAVESEVEQLIAARAAAKVTSPLTVAIDCTIDYVRSSKIRALLERFTPAILAGTVNFVFFQSGQKFWLFGMDHVYGSPFYMVGRGAPDSKAFEMLSSHESFCSDPLSRQWYCLVNQPGVDRDGYRRAIFNNTRAVLDRVPEALQPENRGMIRVSRADPDVDICFLDIKCVGEGCQAVAFYLQERLYERMKESGALLYSRAGYGYFHPNLVKFMFELYADEPCITIRITPGIDPRDNDTLVEFLQEAALLKF